MLDFSSKDCLPFFSVTKYQLKLKRCLAYRSVKILSFLSQTFQRMNFFFNTNYCNKSDYLSYLLKSRYLFA